ncbi:hypothetical protein BOTCAL_0300g00010 [Botryotinia calthae]|uniref:Uncharacterized protein n=1 Tax=Botryotinia calthae TaxID=38488 RepID=A0A4Y8CX44_9HELO|nr:hypothetical protein BOTCAL_0300g00010 [Botryotinia calthae]
MNLTSSSHAASLNHIPPSFINSSASLPTTMTSIQNSTCEDGTLCYITQPEQVYIRPVVFASLIVFTIYTLLSLFFHRFELLKSREEVNRLKIDRLDFRLKQLRLHERKVRKTLWEDCFQEDASELVQVRDLKHMMDIPEDIAIYEYGYDHAKGEVYEILRRRFMERYEVDPSQIEKDSKGMFGPVPTYRQGNTNLLVDSLIPEIYINMEY